MNNTTIESKSLPVFSMYLAGKLMIKGFVLIDVQESWTHKGKHVFFFKDSSIIRKEIENYKINHK